MHQATASIRAPILWHLRCHGREDADGTRRPTLSHEGLRRAVVTQRSSANPGAPSRHSAKAVHTASKRFLASLAVLGLR